jgi:hypothetical protein
MSPRSAVCAVDEEELQTEQPKSQAILNQTDDEGGSSSV